METSRLVFRPNACSSVAGVGRRRRASARINPPGGGFADDGHMSYYSSPAEAVAAAVASPKKKGKLMKGLSKDLKELHRMGGLGVDAGEGKMFLEAAEVLLSQIEKLKAEEKEMKRKKKEEKSAMKAARKKTCTKDESSSSSSSSESSSSSGSDCDRVVDMSRLRTADTVSTMAVPIELPMCTREVKPLEGRECGASVGVLKEKIEVCMGSKCKRSGAGELLEEFQRKVAIDGAVVRCKCMGKCRDGPNVRVRNNHGEDEVFSARVPVMKPLCIGVGLEDVGVIVANVFGDVKDPGLVVT
ncbi:hypothetical protein QJS10_CPB17g00863 [Acorus calamus]|uniref:Diacylglycerol O-acyltransferase 3, cytosolic n=1 Tax=Acorus calamus TaxID=4465 RepID=A0AAV9CW19_ACOCL|nr:hypothetical protein QJS10_CPB17g00863 [Acorus calamus]